MRILSSSTASEECCGLTRRPAETEWNLRSLRRLLCAEARGQSSCEASSLRLRSGQAFDSAEIPFAQGGRFVFDTNPRRQDTTGVRVECFVLERLLWSCAIGCFPHDEVED